MIVAYTICIEDRRLAFADRDLVTKTQTVLGESVAMYSCRVPIYCFMPDHVHIIAQGTIASADTRLAMIRFKQQVGYWFGRNRSEIAWQSGFYDHVVRNDEDLAAQIRYVANNPVRWNLVSHWRDYPYTGAIDFDLLTVLQDVAAD